MGAALAALAGCGQGATSAPPRTAKGAEQVSSAVLLLPGRSEPEKVTYEVVDGVAIMGGDIVLGPVETLEARYGVAARSRYGDIFNATAVKADSHLWPQGVIPYVIAPSVGAEDAEKIAKAIAMVNPSALEVRPRLPTDPDYVVFQSQSGVCNSYLGRIGGPQAIEIGPLCDVGGVAHEILHAAGFEHEQSRSDRDAFITIVWSEIQPGFEYAFEKRSGRDIGPYDYASVMHYGRTAFSRSGRPTIVPHAPNAIIGQRDGLSQGDLAAIATLYGGVGALPGGWQLPGGWTLPPGLPLPAGWPSPGALPVPDILSTLGLPAPSTTLPPCASPEDVLFGACDPFAAR